VNIRLASDEAPNNEELQTESELTKNLVTKWNQLVISDGLVYRRNNSPKSTKLTIRSWNECVKSLLRAFAEVRSSLKRSAERNKRYYDLGVKAKRFHVGLWVLYFNPRKLRGKQIK